jgi:hypothetical protein
MSAESVGGIKCGATSLSSNTSDEKTLPVPGLAVIEPEPHLIAPDLQETNKSLRLSALDTTGLLDSAGGNN